jgi:hypothetical protein
LDLLLTTFFNGWIRSILSLNFTVSQSGGLEIQLYKAQRHVTSITPALTLKNLNILTTHIFLTVLTDYFSKELIFFILALQPILGLYFAAL